MLVQPESRILTRLLCSTWRKGRPGQSTGHGVFAQVLLAPLPHGAGEQLWPWQGAFAKLTWGITVAAPGLGDLLSRCNPTVLHWEGSDGAACLSDRPVLFGPPSPPYGLVGVCWWQLGMPKSCPPLPAPQAKENFPGTSASSGAAIGPRTAVGSQQGGVQGTCDLPPPGLPGESPTPRNASAAHARGGGGVELGP